MNTISNALPMGPVNTSGAPNQTPNITAELQQILEELQQLLASSIEGSQGGASGSSQPLMPKSMPAGGQANPAGQIGTVIPSNTASQPSATLAGNPIAASAASTAGTTGGGNPAASQKPCAASPDPTMAQFATQAPNAQTKRPPGDNRTAQQIIDDNPLLKNLGNQGGIKDQLNQFVGGNMENDPDQAYKAAALLTYIKSSDTSQGGQRSSSLVGDGKIDGFTKDGDARHGTEAGLLQDVVGGGGHPALGWDHLAQTGHNLDHTSDSHVNSDGTNKDNLQWGLEQAGKYVGAFFKGCGHAVIDIITKGRFNPVSIGLTFAKDIGEQEAETAIQNSNLPSNAKKTADKVFGTIDSII